MFVYKINVIDALKEAGYNTTRIRNEKVIGENALTSIRAGEICSIKTLDTICNILECQPSMIIRHIPDENSPTPSE